MAWWFDFAVTALVDDGRAVRTEFRNGRRPSAGDSPQEARRLWRQGSSAGALTIVYPPGGQDAGDLPTRVTLDLPTGITPSLLARFPWEKWLIAAQEYVRSGSIEDDAASKRQSDAVGAVVRRPGRRGHPPAFLEAIAGRYRQLRLEGDAAPVKHIAEERAVSRNTAAGWIKQARERGLLHKPRGRG